jgi:hypothetical protein
MGQAGTAEGALKGISSGCVGKAETDMELLSAAASANYDAPFTMKRFKLLALVAEASGWQLKFD